MMLELAVCMKTLCAALYRDKATFPAPSTCPWCTQEGSELADDDDACKAREKFHNLDGGSIEMIQKGFAVLFMRQTEELARQI